MNTVEKAKHFIEVEYLEYGTSGGYDHSMRHLSAMVAIYIEREEYLNRLEKLNDKLLGNENV